MTWAQWNINRGGIMYARIEAFPVGDHAPLYYGTNYQVRISVQENYVCNLRVTFRGHGVNLGKAYLYWEGNPDQSLPLKRHDDEVFSFNLKVYETQLKESSQEFILYNHNSKLGFVFRIPKLN